MNSNMPLHDPQQWPAGQKIAFRLCFIYLSLQVLTDDFTGNWFAGTMVVWKLGQKIFVPPLLWLNNHFFHFKYMVQNWTTYSGSLHTIRDTIYLLLTIIATAVWTVLDRKRANYNKLLYWHSRALVVALACILFSYGIAKVFPIQMSFPSVVYLHTHVEDMSPFYLIWTTLGYGTPYEIFSGLLEVAAAILILFNRTRVSGLLLTVIIMINVVMLNYTYQIGVLVLSFYILVIALYLLAPYARQLSIFFFTRRPVLLPPYEYTPARNWKAKGIKLAALIFMASSFVFNIHKVYTVYTKTANVNRTRQYSLVKTFVSDHDTLHLIENDTTCWRLWSEKVVDGKRLVTIAPMKTSFYKTYSLEQDSFKHTLSLHPVGPGDTASFYFHYTALNKTDWRLDGTARQKHLSVELQRIRPDTMFNLLKTKRTVITFDDESADE